MTQPRDIGGAPILIQPGLETVANRATHLRQVERLADQRREAQHLADQAEMTFAEAVRRAHPRHPIRDIAAATGYSRSTISRILGNRG
jgi:DNA-binding MarR family transcriptional regulator